MKTPNSRLLLLDKQFLDYCGYLLLTLIENPPYFIYTAIKGVPSHQNQNLQFWPCDLNFPMQAAMEITLVKDFTSFPHLFWASSAGVGVTYQNYIR